MAVTLSKSAAAKVREVRQADGIDEREALRIRVVGGGCSGFTYDLSFDLPTPEDRLIESEGLRVVVDRLSFVYLGDTRVDYVEGPEGEGFRFDNPTTRSAGTCGQSALLR